MPLILPIIGVALVALWWFDTHKPAATVQVTPPSPPVAPPLPPGPSGPGIAFGGGFGGDIGRQLLGGGGPSGPSAADQAALAICIQQLMLARIQAGVTGTFVPPTTLQQCQQLLPFYQGLALAKSALGSGQPSGSGAGAGFGGSAGGSVNLSFGGSAQGSTQMTGGLFGGHHAHHSLAVAAVLAAMHHPMHIARDGYAPAYAGDDDVDDAVRLCTWAVKGANSQTIRGLMHKYATRPNLVASLARRLAHIEPLGF